LDHGLITDAFGFAAVFGRNGERDVQPNATAEMPNTNIEEQRGNRVSLYIAAFAWQAETGQPSRPKARYSGSNVAGNQGSIRTHNTVAITIRRGDKSPRVRVAGRRRNKKLRGN
jgi:hypothetical protein